MRILIFLGFLVLSMLVPVGLAQAQGQPDLQKAEALIKTGNAEEAWKLLSSCTLFKNTGQFQTDSFVACQGTC